MNHTRTVRLPGVTVWAECTSSPKDRYYSQVQQPTSLPTLPFNPADPQPKIGISTIAFNPDGTLIATRNDNMPSTVWIWSLKLLRPYAVLVQLNPIRTISWHPTVPDLLMIQCASDSTDPTSSKQPGVVYLWSATWRQPRAVVVPMDRTTGSSWAKWVLTNVSRASASSSTVSTSPQPFLPVVDRRSNSPEKEAEKRAMLVFGDKEGFLVGYVDDEPVPEVEDSTEAPADDGYAFPLPVNRPWDPVDWEIYSPSHELKRSDSRTSQISRVSTPLQLSDMSKSRGGLGSVMESATS